MRKYSASLAIKEMQIKTTLTLHVTLVRIAIIKNTNNKSWREWVGEELCGNQYEGSSKT
jgi:hypothetical protein